MLCRIWSITAVSTLLLASLGCTTMPWIKEQVPDEPICRHLDERISRKVDSASGQELVLRRPNPTCMKNIKEPRCGYCVWTTADRVQYVGEAWDHLLEVKSLKDGKRRKKTWSTIQEEALTVPAETQAASKAFAINICKITNACADEIDRWRVKLDALDSVKDAFH